MLSNLCRRSPLSGASTATAAKQLLITVRHNRSDNYTQLPPRPSPPGLHHNKHGAAITPPDYTSPYREARAKHRAARRAKYVKKLERIERLKTRQDLALNRGMHRREWDNWFSKKRDWNEIQHKLAKKQGLEFQIQVGLVVERLPVIEPDRPQWKTDYINLNNWFGQFGKEYPPALGMVPPPPPKSEQEILGESFFNCF